MPSRKPASPIAVGDERLLAGARLVGVLEPEADQQVRREPDAFPADEQDEQRPAQHQQQHEEQEQVEVGEVARVARVVLHVADRVDVDQRADAGDDQRHHRGRAGRSRTRPRSALSPISAQRVGGLDERRAAAALQVEEARDREQRTRAIGRPQPTTETKRVPSAVAAARPLSRKPASGRTTISGSRTATSLSFQIRVGVEVERALAAHEQQHDRNGDARSRRPRRRRPGRRAPRRPSVPVCCAKVTRLRLTPFSMSSMHISMTSTLRRTMTPSRPSANSAHGERDAASASYPRSPPLLPSSTASAATTAATSSTDVELEVQPVSVRNATENCCDAERRRCRARPRREGSARQSAYDEHAEQQHQPATRRARAAARSGA